MNHEGYKDPTAENAIKAATAPPEELKRAIKILKAVAKVYGYEITNRIILKDLKTGEEWR